MDTCGNCGSQNIWRDKNVGYNIDESGEEQQHFDVCQDCKYTRFVVDWQTFSGKTGTHFGKWAQDRWAAIAIEDCDNGGD